MMRGLRSLERRLEKIDREIKKREAEQKREAAQVESLEADLNRLCPVCLRIMQGSFEVDINE